MIMNLYMLSNLNKILQDFMIYKIENDSQFIVLHLKTKHLDDNFDHVIYTIDKNNNELIYHECCTNSINNKRTGMGHGSKYKCPFKKLF